MEAHWRSIINMSDGLSKLEIPAVALGMPRYREYSVYRHQSVLFAENIHSLASGVKGEAEGASGVKSASAETGVDIFGSISKKVWVASAVV
jgi:hypothetical protein